MPFPPGQIPAPTPAPRLENRRLWNNQIASSAFSTPPCSQITLPAGGTLVLGTSTISLSAPVKYQQVCGGDKVIALHDIHDDFTEPFYASATPLIYVVATTTILAWTLLVMLLITQNNFPTNNTTRSRGWSPKQGILGVLPSSRSTLHGPSARPLLQKIATALVAISLTIATADTFYTAQYQYRRGYLNAEILRNEVAGTMEVRILRVISAVFLYLAQVQTLIRLFPRQKEKLLIKWFGFLLILLDLIFSSLNSFYIHEPGLARSPPRSYQDAIPALSYLFELSLSLLYAAWVLYYIATKRRYAFYHYLMPNICIVAFFSIISVLIPAAFFVTDIALPKLAGWGDYFRWVGAAAASVIVWEWVERIEAIEREEKKDGILGREVIDEDEMQGSASDDWSQSPGGNRSNDQDDSDEKKSPTNVFDRVVTRLRRRGPAGPPADAEGAQVEPVPIQKQNGHPRPPRAFQDPRKSQAMEPPTTNDTPVSRTDTVSAVSTVYAVHYHPVMDSPAPRPDSQPLDSVVEQATMSNEQATNGQIRKATVVIPHPTKRLHEPSGQSSSQLGSQSRSSWALVAQAFRRKKNSPPPEVKQALSLNQVAQAETQGEGSRSQYNLLRRMGAMTSTATATKASSKIDSEATRLPTVIPAPPRGHTWSPEILRHSPIQQGTAEGQEAENNVEQETANATTPPSIPISSANQVQGSPTNVEQEQSANKAEEGTQPVQEDLHHSAQGHVIPGEADTAGKERSENELSSNTQDC